MSKHLTINDSLETPPPNPKALNPDGDWYLVIELDDIRFPERLSYIPETYDRTKPLETEWNYVLGPVKTRDHAIVLARALMYETSKRLVWNKVTPPYSKFPEYNTFILEALVPESCWEDLPHRKGFRKPQR